MNSIRKSHSSAAAGSSPSPRVAILGAGANGGSIAADLLTHGVDTTLIEQWPAHVERIRRDGLLVVTGGDRVRVRPRSIHLCELAEERERFDVVLMLMKAYDAAWAARLIAPYLADDGLLAAVQNGMTTDAAADAVGEGRTVGTVIEVSAALTSPGVIHRHTPPERSWFAVGAREGGPADRLDEVVRLLSLAGRVQRFDDIESAKWMKIVSNAMLLVPSAILGLSMLDTLHAPGMREVMLRAGEEALRAGIARGHAVQPIFGLTESDVADQGAVVATMLDALFAGFVVPGATTTVHQDWSRGRRSEVDDINGTVVAEGAAHGVPAPVNAVIVELAHRIEAGAATPSIEHLDVLIHAAA